MIKDTLQDKGKRWVVVAPPDSQGAALLLAQAATPEQLAHVGNQTGGRVFLFLPTRVFPVWSNKKTLAGRQEDGSL